LKDEYTPEEQEYDEIFLLLLKYHQEFPKILKEIDKKTWKKFNEKPNISAIINLHWQMFSISDSIVMFNTQGNYRSASILLRTMMELMLYVYYFDRYPDEARRWKEFQNLQMEKVLGIDKKSYYEYLKFSYDEFVEYLKERKYQNISHITEKYYKQAQRFDPSFLRWNVDYERYFKDISNYEEIQMSCEIYDILSKETHPTFTLFEPSEKDIEIELWNIKSALSFTETVLKIIFQEIQDHISEKSYEELHLLWLSMLKVLDKKSFDNYFDSMNDLSDGEKEEIQYIKEKGFLHLPVHDGCRLVHDRNKPLRDDLVKEYQNERKQNPKQAKEYFDLQKEYFEISSKMVDMCMKVNIKDIVEDLDKDLFTLLSALLFNNSILVYTITHLNYYRKYSESRVILRSIVESAQMMMYFYQYPFEMRRWYEVQGLCIQKVTKTENIGWYWNLDLEGLLSHFKKQGYPEETKALVNERNLSSAKWFTPSFIHRQIDYQTIIGHRGMRETFHQLADFTSLHTHPSVAMSFYRNERLLGDEIFSLGNACQMYYVMMEIMLDRFQDFFLEEDVEEIGRLFKLKEKP